MSEDYRHKPVAGKAWRRTNHIEINVPYGGVATVRFEMEERVAIEGGNTFSTPAGTTMRRFEDPSTVLEICDPNTGEPTGQVITHGGLYAILWSLAMESARLQDAEDQRAAEAAAAQAMAEEARLREDSSQ